MENGNSEIPNWFIMLGTGIVTTIIAFATALVARTPALHNAINNRLRTLIDEQDKKIAELSAMVATIQKELEHERECRLHYEALLRIRIDVCGPCDKWSKMVADLIEKERIALAPPFSLNGGKITS